jgi:hypothetical protein
MSERDEYILALKNYGPMNMVEKFVDRWLDKGKDWNKFIENYPYGEIYINPHGAKNILLKQQYNPSASPRIEEQSFTSSRITSQPKSYINYNSNQPPKAPARETPEGYKFDREETEREMRGSYDPVLREITYRVYKNLEGNEIRKEVNKGGKRRRSRKNKRRKSKRRTNRK